VEAYAKVRIGWTHLLFAFFNPGTPSEDEAAAKVEAMLDEHPSAVASVSVECAGAMAGYPVIGEFPIGAPTVREERGQLTGRQRELLLCSCRDGGMRAGLGPLLRTANVMLKRGLIEVVGGQWVATLEGRAAVGASVETKEAA
jgi:hypothetical protein